ncbi:Uncharacterized protein BWGO95_04930 [Bacillus mycoides]|uniref:Uncharacterized protein n=1 Tax=Bacillus mycoides TaxID=1405 RepID=A0A1G4EXJ6_BACMY|nr:Uncharacterized protein BWGO95_04930 [Bacillus mycoides]
MINQKIILTRKIIRRTHSILRIVIALTVIIMSAIGLYTAQNNFLPLSQFLLGVLMFLIAIEQIKKKEDPLC